MSPLRPAPRAVLAILAVGALFATCREATEPRMAQQASPPTTLQASVTPLPTVTLVGAGNVARCDRTNDEATASILDTIPGSVFVVGDGAYPGGTATVYQNCFALSWGRHKARTYPVPGHRDYDSSATATGYFGYWGAQAGDPTKGYYSYDLGAWHVVVLNSNNTYVPTGVGSAQETWLKADLAATAQKCVVALFHAPRFYSTTTSTFSPTSTVKAFWDDLYAAKADLIVNAHMRDYERFAPQTSAGVADPVNGIREIIVGTGGDGLDGTNTLRIPNSEVNLVGVYGVLKLTLADGSYAWQFIAVSGTASDAGNGTCHRSPATGPVMPLVNAGQDLLAHPGDSVRLSVTFTDPGPNDAPWSYSITWGDGSPATTGNAAIQSAPITASHVYSALGLDSVRIGVTNAPGITGWDTVAVQLIATNPPVVFAGAGDIADCAKTGDSLTANLLDTIPGTVFTVGDNAYPSGSTADYANCYGPTWGRQKARTRPVPGNHEYSTQGATPYFAYFGAAAGDPTKGYYSYDLGDWHIIALNSNIADAAGSAQEQWLRADLATHPVRCTLAYFHHPLFSSGTLEDTSVRALWQALYDGGADLVLNGHDHDYERFAPQTPAGLADSVYGIREFVVGMGGAGLFTFSTPAPNSQVRNDVTYGVLKLTLNSTGYDWKFLPIAGKTFTDAGSATCHDSPNAVNHPPTASAGGPYSGSEAAAVSFDASGSSDQDRDALTYAWSFGDGSTGTGVRPSHAYADNGAYTVTLTVTDARGAGSAAVTTTATIANAAPTVNAGSNQTATVGAAFSLSVAFTDPGVNDAPWAYSIAWGDSSAAATGSTTSQSTPIAATHTYSAPGTDTVRVTVTDKDGAPGAGLLVVTVAPTNHAPTAVAGGPYSGTEATAVSLDGRGSSDPDGDALTYAWSLGDGTSATGANPSHAYADNGTYTVTLTVTDARGAASAPATTTVTVANAAPLVTAGPDQAVNLGAAYTLNATFSDPGVNDGPWAYSIDWGDASPATTGSATSQANPIAATHSYAAPGTDVVRVTVTDKDGGAGSGQLTVTVTAVVNHPPTAAAGGPYTGTEGALVSFDGSGSADPDGDALTYAWNFGDGSGGSGVRPSHAYVDNGAFTVTLTVTDAHGAASTPATAAATIANTAPSVNAGANQTATVGSPFTLTATFSDPGVNDAPWPYSVDWGDGSFPTTGNATSQASPIAATHTYAAAGTSTVRVTVTDKDGAAGVGTKLVTVSAPPATVTLVGAGNIARCDRTNDEATASILDTIPGNVFVVGDGAYPGGTATVYQNCFASSWGRHRARTYPVPGHRDYDSSSTATGYFGYWGAQAGDPAKGYYSYDLGAWHVVVLNSNNTYVPTGVGSAQETWLKSDLATTTKQCVLALFHAPRFYSNTSTTFSPTSSVKPFWDDLYAAKAELIVNAHMRDYERFAPQTSAGVADPVNGIREIIVGTGGDGLDLPNTLIIPNSEARISNVYGVLKLTLGDGTYAWQFIPVAGQTATDSGSGTCH